MSLKKNFGLRLKELRNKKGITQYQLAELSDIDPKHISHIETGRSFPKADLIEKFANSLGVNYVEFFKFEQNQNREVLIQHIISVIGKASDEEIKTIFKILQAYLN